ncbi:MAG TPA: Fic family protein [Solirubrobacteraceae bacterium]
MADDDPYVYPGTSVLRNHFGIRDAAELAGLEAAISAGRIAQLEREFIPGDYDTAHLQAVHRKIFGDLYPWAGELRAVKIAKDESMFALPQHVAAYLAGVLSDLAGEDRLVGLERDDFVTRLTHYYAELNAVHPFREGNGRTQRAFLGHIASDTGHPIDWTGLDPDRNIEASRESHRGDNKPLEKLLDGLIAD